ncbi:hypothetical protein MMC26_006596 [Xylographa opegraphella]|nr:hypothetical protein [Xylographa opegraphella]
MPQSTPPFGALRLASPIDIKRISIIATCGFFGGPVCAYYRPFITQYPEDTLASYFQIFSAYMKSPRHVVLVAVDSYDALESTKSELKFPVYDEEVVPVVGEQVIVGVAVWALEESSQRIRDFQHDHDAWPEVPHSENRDQHQEHSRILGARAHAAQARYFEAISELEMLVVHPAYQSHGHGGALVRWGQDLARMDGVKQGVIGPAKGMKLYRSLGFDLLDELQWPGDEITPDGLQLGVLRFDPHPMK